MNHSQLQIKHYMDYRIQQMEEGLDCIRDREAPPDSINDLYNGMLKHSVGFEILHMRKLRDDLMKELED